MQANREKFSDNTVVVNELKGTDPICKNINILETKNKTANFGKTKSKRGNSSPLANHRRNARRYSNRKWPKLLNRIKSLNHCIATIMASVLQLNQSRSPCPKFLIKKLLKSILEFRFLSEHSW